MLFDFTGYGVIATGGSKGIGRGIAASFSQAGASVSICARGEELLSRTRAELKRGGFCHSETCALSDGRAVRRYIAKAGTALGGIDVLVINASGFGRVAMRMAGRPRSSSI